MLEKFSAEVENWGSWKTFAIMENLKRYHINGTAEGKKFVT